MIHKIEWWIISFIWMKIFSFYNGSVSFFSPQSCSSLFSLPDHRKLIHNTPPGLHSGSEDIGMGYTKSLGVLSRYAGQETGSTAFVRCQRSRQRGPEKVSKHKHDQSIPNLSAELFGGETSRDQKKKEGN